MSTFSIFTEPDSSVPLSAFKHVNYVLGMVLGVDDLKQEFAYHNGHNHWLTRAVLGYGTVNGLGLSTQVTECAGKTDIGLIVRHGTAISPQGALIRVDEAYCACLNRWIEANRGGVIEVLGEAPTRTLTLYVVLSYRPCPTDEVLIPGEPCRDEKDARAFSRVTDDFELALAFEPPEQIEVDALRMFVAWLSDIVWLDEADSDSLRTDFGEALLTFNDGPHLFSVGRDFVGLLNARQLPPELREQFADIGHNLSPEASVEVDQPENEWTVSAGNMRYKIRRDADMLNVYLSIPPTAPVSPLRVPREAAEDYLQRALRLWVTEIRPNWLGVNADASGLIPGERRVLLGELQIPLTDELAVTAAEDILISEDDRPILAHLQLLQRLLSLSGHAALDSVGETPGPPPVPVPGPSPVPVSPMTVMAAGRFTPMTVVAAGRFTRLGASTFSFGNLTALQIAGINLFYLVFDAFDSAQNYVVKGTPIIPGTAASHTFEMISIRPEDEAIWLEILASTTPASRRRIAAGLDLAVDPAGDVPPEIIFRSLSADPAGVMVRIQDAAGNSEVLEFDVEISAYSGA